MPSRKPIQITRPQLVKRRTAGAGTPTVSDLWLVGAPPGTSVITIRVPLYSPSFKQLMGVDIGFILFTTKRTKDTKGLFGSFVVSTFLLLSDKSQHGLRQRGYSHLTLDSAGRPAAWARAE